MDVEDTTSSVNLVSVALRGMDVDVDVDVDVDRSIHQGSSGTHSSLQSTIMESLVPCLPSVVSFYPPALSIYIHTHTHS
jgi:hypothetical protein